MSKETDLDLLARNVHEWPTNTPQIIPAGDSTFGHGCTFYENYICIYHKEFENSTVIYKYQWLDRRAELQNKPSFADHPDAKCFVQDGYGNWLKNTLTSHAEVVSDFWRATPSDGFVFICAGTIIGDWSDTLERRPEEFKPSIEEANRLVQEFKPFISIEDNQQQEVKQDNGWFERGELPPVGVECEILGAFEHYQKWTKCKIIAEHNGSIFAANERSWVNVKHGERKFRQIRTERDELIILIKAFRYTLRSDGEVADAILAAGFKLEAK